jgi:Type I phosphodiesterase / nucleotide pyrophosphatase
VTTEAGVGAAPAVAPEPVVPDFGGQCLTEVVPALLRTLQTAGGAGLPTWIPRPLTGARQVVLLVLDGLGARQLQERLALAPVLASGDGPAVTSVAPSTTAVALTSLTTGLPPAAHGTVGYRVAVGGRILNVLTWRLGGRDGRQEVPARRFQPFPAFPGAGRPPVVSRSDYGATGFTASHLGDAQLRGWYTPSGLAVEVRRVLAAGHPFVYAYYDGIDKTAHARGFGDHYDAELRAVDRLVSDVLEVLPPGAALVVTADHGQVEVGGSVEVLGPEIMGGVEFLSGEGRYRWLHARPGAVEDVAAAAHAAFGGVAWVRTYEEVVDAGWMGGEPTPDVRARLGDVVLAPFTATAFLDPADTGEQRLVCRHGSLTDAEMLVPFLAWQPRSA